MEYNKLLNFETLNCHAVASIYQTLPDTSISYTTCRSTHMHSHVHTHIHVLRYTSTHTHTFTYTLIHIHMHKRTSAHTHTNDGVNLFIIYVVL